MALYDVIGEAVRNQPAQSAVVEGDDSGRLDYAELELLSNGVRDQLAARQIGRGHRVGLYLRKSADGIAAIFGILKAGAAYVPVDPTAPASRNAYIHHDCGVRAVIIEQRFVGAYLSEYLLLGGDVPPLLVLEEVGGGTGLAALLARLDPGATTPSVPNREVQPDDLAYILYTSGSTGRPKGVMLTHKNALSFVDWCSNVFQPTSSDVFSSHAPLHFDLSILDVFVSLKHGAKLVLIPEQDGKDPQLLSRIIHDHRITIWYSAPSILSLLAQFGRIAEHDFSSLRIVLFAGEVFPIVHLRSFKRQVPQPRYFNLYGPTETNVCTYFEIPASIPDERTEPYPIGITCEMLLSKVVDAEGKTVAPGTEGELCIAGPNVMTGYWNLPEQTAHGFLPDDGTGTRWYRTGDIVTADDAGCYRYLGRRDRMIKRRGYRVELGEIEGCLYRHAAVREAAVVAVPDAALGNRVAAHISVRANARPSIIELKTHCSRHLPLYMVPDTFAFHEALPKTSTDKTDYQQLQRLA